VRRSIWAELLRGTSFLWRKFFFFAAIGIVLGVAGSYFHPVQRITAWADSLRVVADQPALPEDEILLTEPTLPDESAIEPELSDEQFGTETINLEITKKGEVRQEGRYVSPIVETQIDTDVLRIVVFDGETRRPVQGYINSLQVIVNLPKVIDPQTIPEEGRRLITAHGVGTVSASYFTNNNQTIVLEAESIASTEQVTVYLEFPSGYLELGTIGALKRIVNNFSGFSWLVLSVLLPLIGLVVLINIYARTTGESLARPPLAVVQSPPDNLPPPLVGVLLHGRIRSQEILSTIVDLANRGFLGIEDKDGEMLIYKKNVRSLEWKNLRAYEKTLIEEFFNRGETLSTGEEIEVRVSNDLFSQRVTRVYEQIYEQIVSMQFFAKNPAFVHWRYRIYGLIMIFFGGGGFIFTMVTARDPKYTLLLWAGLMGMGFLAVAFAGRISMKTAKGKAEARKWLAFRNYLALNKKATVQDSLENEFEQYLPFALSMDVEFEWAKRFAQTDFRLPRWYGVAQNIVDMEGFINSFYPLLGKFTQKLSYLKEPVIE